MPAAAGAGAADRDEIYRQALRSQRWAAVGQAAGAAGLVVSTLLYRGMRASRLADAGANSAMAAAAAAATMALSRGVGHQASQVAAEHQKKPGDPGV